MTTPPPPHDDVEKLIAEWENQVAHGHTFPTSIAEQRMLLSHIRSLQQQVKEYETFIIKCSTAGDPISGESLRRQATELLSSSTPLP